MWLIFAATLSLAALVNYQQRQARRIILAPPAAHGDLKVRLPLHWRSTSRTEEQPLVVITAQESDEENEEYGRRLTILRQRTGAMISPAEYLLRNGWIDETALVAPESESSDLPSFQRTEVAGWPGVMIAHELSQHPLESPEPITRKQVIACTVLPSGQAITVNLQGWGRSDWSDLDLVKRVAEQLVIEPQIKPDKTGGEVTLSGGIQLSVPEKFLALPAPDPNRIARDLLLEDPQTAWTAVELVPCILLPGQTPASLLTVREGDWSGAVVKEEQPGRWRIDPPDTPAAGLFPVRAYVARDESNQALLAIFRGGLRENSHFDSAWETISQSLRFSGPPDLTGWLQAGTEEATRLSDIGLDELIGKRGGEQWWLWAYETPEHYLGWTHSEYDPAQWTGRQETRWRRGDRHLLRVIQEWRGEPDMKAYLTKMERHDASARAEAPFSAAFAHLTQLQEDVLTMTLVAPGKPLAAWKTAPPPQYIPGGWLPHLMGQLSDRPMILRTEWFTGYEWIIPLEPLILLIVPSSEFPKTAEGQGQPMRCLTIQVNGSGQISRWYFDSDGELASADFADGIHLLPSDPQRIGFDFGNDERMTP